MSMMINALVGAEQSRVENRKGSGIISAAPRSFSAVAHVSAGLTGDPTARPRPVATDHLQRDLRGSRFGERHPVLGSGDGPIAEHRQPALVRSPPQAAPGPVLRPANQVRPQRIAFHVAQHQQQMQIALDGKALEPSLVQMAGSGTGVVGVHNAACACASSISRTPRPRRRCAATRRNARGWASGSRRRCAATRGETLRPSPARRRRNPLPCETASADRRRG